MRFLITAGPTREPLDPARHLTNRSSGRMGYALAGAARHDGHEALLISGPTTLEVAYSEQKIKKQGERMVLELERTPDILRSMRSVFGFTGTLIGFAAETRDVEAYARGKLERKQCDMVVGNDVSRSDIGFDSRENEVVLVFPDHVEYLEKDTKEHIAMHIIEHATIIRPK